MKNEHATNQPKSKPGSAPVLTEAFLRRYPEALSGKTPSLRGSVQAEYKRCGKIICRCATGAPHGPYHYLVASMNGKLTKKYVRSRELDTVKQLCGSHKIARTTFKLTLAQFRLNLK